MSAKFAFQGKNVIISADKSYGPQKCTVYPKLPCILQCFLAIQNTAEKGKQVLHLSQPLPGVQWQKDPTPYA